LDGRSVGLLKCGIEGMQGLNSFWQLDIEEVLENVLI
jgi:hypothetical protein